VNECDVVGDEAPHREAVQVDAVDADRLEKPIICRAVAAMLWLGSPLEDPTPG
jgi:hypothetical protein